MINDEIKEQQAKMQDKPFSAKLKYFWDYYKIHTLVVIVVIIGLVTLVRDIVRNNREPSIYVAMVNTNYYSAEELTLLDEYITARNIDTDVNPATLDLSIHFDESISVDIAMVAYEKFLALLNNSVLDVAVCDSDVIDEYGPHGAFANLEEVIPPEMLEKHKDHLYYVKTTEGAEFPVGIYVDTCEKLTKNKTYSEDVKPIVTIAGKTTRPERAVDFINFLFE